MGIRKQEFYEGAALYLLTRGMGLSSIRYKPPLFLLNDELLVLLKYSTKGRSPWGFTFMPSEQELLELRAVSSRLIIGLICGSDGVAAIPYEEYRLIAAPRGTALHVACYRTHGQHYEVNGPDGTLASKVAPSAWRKILQNGEPG